jgi:RpiR family carbohydrate utilization transcriptional regulator
MILKKLDMMHSSLSKSEKKVADYILSRPEDVIHHSITELAEIVGVGEATVYRLVRKLGFDGFQRFKIELARQLSREEVTEEGPLQSIVSEIEDVIKTLKKISNYEDFAKAVDYIVESDRVVFFGVGLSGVVAQYGGIKLSMLRIPAFYYNDPHLQVVVAANLTEKDTVIAISHSGNIRDTVKSAKVAKDVRAKVIVITAGMDSPLSKIGDIVLYSGSQGRKMYDFMRGNVGEIVVVELLFRMTLQRVFEERKEHFEEVSRILRPKKY